MRISITPAEAGVRLDKLVVDKVPGLGRAGAKRLFSEGKVRVLAGGEGRPRRAAKGDVATPGDAIEIDLADTTVGEAAVPEPEGKLEVVLETKDVVVLEKPSGQPTAPIAAGEKGTLANALVARYPELGGIGFSPREPGLCHRLDTGTSGLLLAGRTAKAFDTLSRALKEGRLEKRYLLVCKAEGLPESGVIDFPLAPHPKDKRRVYACVHPRDVARLNPRPASTSWTRVREHGDWALVEASAPKAARHQIRAHFAAIDHPLAGDALYGGPEVPSLGSRHALHASSIVWKGDPTVPAFTVDSPLPAELEALLSS